MRDTVTYGPTAPQIPGRYPTRFTIAGESVSAMTVTTLLSLTVQNAISKEVTETPDKTK